MIKQTVGGNIMHSALLDHLKESAETPKPKTWGYPNIPGQPLRHNIEIAHMAIFEFLGFQFLGISL